MASYKEIVLAAWLHDIGKFAQRAGEECSKELEGQLCKLQDGGWYSHQHVLYTERFLQTIKDSLPDDVDVQIAEVIRLASTHHNPSTSDEWIIAHGDRLSSGADRCNIILEQKNRDDETPAKFYEKPLFHLVSTLRIKEKPEPLTGYSPLQPLEGQAIFASDNAKVSKEDYQKLWVGFINDFHALKGLKYCNFMESLDTLMERYCWCIPSTTMQDADISLYQHSKTTAAFAGVLYLYQKENNTETGSTLNTTDEPFLFIQGDMSGIQKYIIDLKTTKNNAKLLRARSFQIWTLGEIIAEYLTGQFGVSRENIITSAGGKFLLLVPNTTTVKGKLPELRLEIEKYFLDEFAGRLSFVLSECVSASISEVQQDKMQELLKRIGEQGDFAKQKKMQAVLGKDGHVLTELYERLQKNGECTCCETLPADLEFEDEKICKNCHKLIEIGGKLVKANKVILKANKLSHFGEMVFIPREDDEQFGYLVEYKAGYPLMTLPYVAPVKYENENTLCSFEEIADKASGSNKLAMFKADIDNLGLVFASSWGDGAENRRAFSRYAQLSRHLHYFFSAYLVDFINSSADYKEKIYTVFSGGDDLCVLGAWDTIMHFAADFQRQLSAFTNNNPSVTLSGGIALAGSRLPVRTIAAAAEEALEEAKGRKDKAGNIVKNGISVFGVTVSWAEYEQSLKDAEKIVQYIDNDIVSSTMVYKMIDFANRAREVKKGNLRDLLWMSNYRYVIARNIDSKHKDAIDFFHKFGVSPETMEKSLIAVSYALYKNRNGKEEE